jgi:hypothetical protein
MARWLRLVLVAVVALAALPAYAQIVPQSVGTGTLDNQGVGSVPIHTYSQGECAGWGDTSILCATDGDCDAACVGSGDPGLCCTGAGAGTCTCEERRAEGMYLVPVVGPWRARLTLTGSVQQLFGGAYTPAYSCALWLDPEDAGPFCYGPATLDTDCDTGVKVPWSGSTSPSDRRDASSIYVVGTSGETLNIECGG